MSLHRPVSGAAQALQGQGLPVPAAELPAQGVRNEFEREGEGVARKTQGLVLGFCHGECTVCNTHGYKWTSMKCSRAREESVFLYISYTSQIREECMVLLSMLEA